MRKKKNKNKVLKKKSIEEALKNQKNYELGSIDPESFLILDHERRKRHKEELEKRKAMK